MAIELVKEYFKEFGMENQIQEYEASSATVELAAAALNVESARIAKTLSFKMEDGCILIVAAGDTKIDNAKFKSVFGVKAKMLSPVEFMCFHPGSHGGVCPFGIPAHINVYLDESLKRFETVFPACGSSNSAIELSCEELFIFAKAAEWVDVCKGWYEEETTNGYIV